MPGIDPETMAMLRQRGILPPDPNATPAPAMNPLQASLANPYAPQATPPPAPREPLMPPTDSDIDTSVYGGSEGFGAAPAGPIAPSKPGAIGRAVAQFSGQPQWKVEQEYGKAPEKPQGAEATKSSAAPVGWQQPGATEGQGAAPLRLPPGMGPQVVGAHDVSTVSPETRAQGLGALDQQRQAALAGNQAERDVNDQTAQGYRQEAVEHALSSDEQLRKAADIRRAMGSHMAEQEKLDAEAARGIDPNRYMKSLGVPKQFMAAIASASGAFGATLSHSHQNYAQNIIDNNINRDIDAQRQDIENARGKASAHRSEYARKLQLLGDPNAAEAASKADRYAMAAAMAKYQATQTNDSMLKARAQAIGADFAAKSAAYNQETHKYVQAAVTGGGLQDKILKRMQEIRNQSGGSIGVDDARQAATAEVMSAYGPTGVQGLYQKPGAGKAGDQKEMLANQDAIASIDQLMALRRAHNGGTLSPEDRARASAIAARTQERLVAALGRTNAQLLERTQHLIPDQPLEMRAAGLVGSDPIGAQLQQAKQLLVQEAARRGQAPPGGGSDVDDLVKGAGEEE